MDNRNTTPAMSAETVPSEEFVLVPREPTPAMQRAYFDSIDTNMHRVEKDVRFGRYENMRTAYRAMIAAAPAPNPSPATKGGDAVWPVRLAETQLDWSYDGPSWFAIATFPNGEKLPVNSLVEQSRIETAYRIGLSTPTEGPASQTEGMGGDALHRVAAMARGYELMQRAIWNMAGTSVAKASWYRNTALAITGRVDPLWKVEKLSNCSRPGDCLTQADKFVAALTPPETVEAVKALEKARIEGMQAGLEMARHAYEAHDRTNRDWVKDSLWDKLNREAAARVAALITEKSR